MASGTEGSSSGFPLWLDELVVISSTHQLFYDEIRDWIICFTLYLTLCVPSYALMARARAQADTTLAFVLCVFALAVALFAVLMVPLAVVSRQLYTESEASHPNPYLVWLSRALLERLWSTVFVGSIVSLFGLIPFAFLYNQAVGWGRSRSVGAKIYETSVVLCLLSLLVAGFFFLIQQALDVDTKDYLPFSYSLVSAAGSLLFLFCTPIGFTALISWSVRYYTPLNARRKLDDEYNRLRFEEAALERRLQQTGLQDGVRDGIARELATVSRARSTASAQLVRSPLRRNIQFLLFNGLAFFFFANVVLRVFFLPLHDTVLSVTGVELDSIVLFWLKPLSHPGLSILGAVFDSSLILYFVASSLVGFYSIFPGLRPRSARTSVDLLISNTFVFLVMSTAFPVVAHIIGLTSFDLMHYSTTAYLHLWYVVSGYNLVFLVSIAFQILMLWKTTTVSFLSEWGSWRRRGVRGVFVDQAAPPSPTAETGSAAAFGAAPSPSAWGWAAWAGRWGKAKSGGRRRG